MNTELQVPKIPLKECIDTIRGWAKSGKVKQDPIKFANCVWNLVYRYYGGSFEKAAIKVKLTTRTLQRLASIVKLPPKVKQYLRNGDIGIDIAQAIAGLNDPDVQVDIANIVRGMPVKDARSIISLAKKCPYASFQLFKQRLLSSKERGESIYEVVLPFKETEFTKLQEEARKMKINVDELCLKIIVEWLGLRAEENEIYRNCKFNPKRK